MKTKSVALILVIVFLLSVFTACNISVTPPVNQPTLPGDGNELSGDNSKPAQGDTSNPNDGQNPPAGGNLGEENIPEQIKMPNGFYIPNGSGEYAEVVDTAILSLSYNRLNSADFDFQLNVGTEKPTAEAVNTRGVTSSSLSSVAKKKVKLLSNRSTIAREYTASADELAVPTYDYNFLKSEQEIASLMGNEARNISDFVTENITVMNVSVHYGCDYYLLKYDADTDSVYVVKHVLTPFSNIYTVVQITNNEDGEEVIDMWEYSHFTNDNQSYGHTRHLTYIANKYYFIANNQWGYGANGEYYSTYNLSTAYIADDGYWRGIRTHFAKDNAFLTKEGVYDYANGLIYFDFLFETDKGMYTFTERFVPYRDGQQVGSEQTALKTDEFRIEQLYLQVPGVTVQFEYSWGMLQVNFATLTNWTELLITVDTESELNQTGMEYAINDFHDVFTLVGGKKLTGQCVWTPSNGIVSCENWVYIDADGKALNYDDIDWDNSLRFSGYTHIYEGEILDGGMRLFFDRGELSQKLELIQQFMDEMELGFVEAVSATVFDDMAKIQRRHTEYTEDLYRTLYGCKFTADNVSTIETAIAETLDSFEQDIQTEFEKYTQVEFDEQPEKNDNDQDPPIDTPNPDTGYLPLYSDVGERYSVVIKPLKDLAERITSELVENEVVQLPQDAQMYSMRYFYGECLIISFKVPTYVGGGQEQCEFLYEVVSISVDELKGGREEWLSYRDFLVKERQSEGLSNYEEIMLPLAQATADKLAAYYEELKQEHNYSTISLAHNTKFNALNKDSYLSATYNKIVAKVNEILSAKNLPLVTDQTLEIRFGGNLNHEELYDCLQLTINLQNYRYLFEFDFNEDCQYTEKWINHYQATINFAYWDKTESQLVPPNEEYAEFFDLLKIEEMNFEQARFYTLIDENTFLYF